MDKLSFSKNWNGAKLDCEFFTTIRMYNPKRHFIGAKWETWLNGDMWGTTVTRDARVFTLSNLDEYTARLDTGMSRHDTIVMLRNMYTAHANTLFVVLLQGWEKQPLLQDGKD